MKKSSQWLQDLTSNFLLIQGILGHPLFCVHIDDKSKDVRYGLLGISFDSKKAEIRSIIDNLPDTSYLYNIPRSGWTKKVIVTSVVLGAGGGWLYFLNFLMDNIMESPIEHSFYKKMIFYSSWIPE